MFNNNSKKGMGLNYQVFIAGVLVVTAIFAVTLYNMEKNVFSENIDVISDVIARDLSNIIKVISTLDQGVYFYELPTDTYEINVSSTEITVINRNVNCEEGCGSTYVHSGKYVQASYVLLGTKRICIVKKYREDNLSITYLCNGEGEDLRCNCDIGQIYGVSEGERYEDDDEPKCNLKLTCLDNYGVVLKPGGEVKEENFVKMTIEANNCEGMYLSPTGTPYKDWSYGKPVPDNTIEEKYTALRHYETYLAYKHGPNPSEEQLQPLEDEKAERHIDSPIKEITLTYVCKGENGDNFILDLVARPDNYPIDDIAKIQTYVGCGEEGGELKPFICTAGCYPPSPPGNGKNKCEDKTKYYCDRSDGVYADFCVPEYYDTNCQRRENIC